jgi:hypothetical protein
MAGGFTSAMSRIIGQLAQGQVPTPLNEGGFWIGLGGFLTSLGAVGLGYMRQRTDDRMKAQEQERWRIEQAQAQERWRFEMDLKLKAADHERVEARHNISNKVDNINVKSELHSAEIDRLKERLDAISKVAQANRKWMIAQSKRHGDALPDGFDSQEFEQVREGPAT